MLREWNGFSVGVLLVRIIQVRNSMADKRMIFPHLLLWCSRVLSLQLLLQSSSPTLSWQWSRAVTIFTPDIHVHESLSSPLMGQLLRPCSSCSTTYMSIVSVVQTTNLFFANGAALANPRILSLQKEVSHLRWHICPLPRRPSIPSSPGSCMPARVQAASSNQSVPYAVALWLGTLSCNSFPPTPS